MTQSQPRMPDVGTSLDDLRAEIDRIDETLHGLLMERGEIIDRLIAVKARQGHSSAFRPGREAEMMRRLVSRHEGILPLDTVEGIWRIIISTFTYVQAPYTVHADCPRGDLDMHDAARFHFGFTVPLDHHDGSAAVIAAVAAAEGDLGLIRAEGGSGAWWTPLMPEQAPKIIARLPFVERADHVAGLPLFVVSKPLAEAAASALRLYAGGGAPVRQDLPEGVEIVARADGPDAGILIAAPGEMSAETVAQALYGREPHRPLVPVGSHARRFEITAEGRAAAQ